MSDHGVTICVGVCVVIIVILLMCRLKRPKRRHNIDAIMRNGCGR